MKIEHLYHQITDSIEGFNKRQSQLEMVVFIDQVLSSIKIKTEEEQTVEEAAKATGHNIALVEAPTGTGKSFAYLLACIINAKKHHKKLLISTATKVLQSQLFMTDLPKFIKASGLDINYGLAKGRSNYLCPYQLEISQLEAMGSLLDASDNTSQKLKKLHKAFETGKWKGELDLAPIMVDNALKSRITIDRHQCLGSSCQFNQKDSVVCPYYKNREILRSCDVVITNHSLLVADLSNGAGSVLPFTPEQYFLCVDEAHNLASYALNGFTGELELKSAIHALDELAKMVVSPSNNSYLLDKHDLCDTVCENARSLADDLDKLLKIFKANLNHFKDNVFILNDYINEVVSNEIMDLFLNCHVIAQNLLTDTAKVITYLKDKAKEGNDFSAESNIIRLGIYISVLELIASTSEGIINKDDSRYNANAKWVSYQIRQDRSEMFIVNSAPTYMGNLLLNKLWSRVYGASLVSATLAIGESFEYFKFQLGMNILPEIQTKKLETSFDYTKQAQLVIPQFKYTPDYATRNEFTEELTGYLRYMLNYKLAFGTLVLFFNKAQLLEIYAKLPPMIQDKILLQTDFASNQKLIEEHKKWIDKGEKSIIFGLNSFAEGVDLPSKYCMHVIITKLPFETHKTPAGLVKNYWIEAEKGNYFMEVSLPETTIKLVQAIGRLIRSEHDYGQITICDNRIVLKQYGKMLLSALPKFNMAYNPMFIPENFAKVK